jgi:hypothetical protein
MHNASLQRSVELQKQDNCHEATNAALPITSNITTTAVMKQDATTAACEALLTEMTSRCGTKNELLLVYSRQSNTEITKTRATKDAIKAKTFSRADKPQ